MSCQSSLTLLISIAALTLTPLFIPGDAAVHEPVAAAAPSGEASLDGGLSLPFIHWQSPMNPHLDPTVTMLDVVKEEIKFASTSPEAEATAGEKYIVPFRRRPRGSLYLVQLRIGEPTDQISSRYVMFDTGTDLSWTQCAPCMNCSRTRYPPLDTSQSTTFRRLPCDDPMCEHGLNIGCSITGLCIFGRLYGDRRNATGYLASDIFHFGLAGDDGPDGYHFEQQVVFGCALVEHVLSAGAYDSGILGLGMGSLSFAAQLRVDKFSYCAPSPERIDAERTNYLRFGTHAQISGKRVPFKQDGSRFVVYLKSVTYQRGSRLNQQQPVPIFAREEAAEYLPILVDSGTVLLWLPSFIFYPLQKKIEDDISLLRVNFPSGPNVYCYIGDLSDVEEVSVTLRFDGGEDLELFGEALFFEADGGNYVCLGAAAGDEAVLGMYAQRNTNVGYDLSNMEIAFDRAGCV